MILITPAFMANFDLHLTSTAILFGSAPRDQSQKARFVKLNLNLFYSSKNENPHTKKKEHTKIQHTINRERRF